MADSRIGLACRALRVAAAAAIDAPPARLGVPGGLRSGRNGLPAGQGAGLFELARVALPAILLVAAFVGFLYDNRDQLTLGEGDLRLNLASVAGVTLLGVSALATCFVHGEVAKYLAVTLKMERDHSKPIAHGSPSWQVFTRTPENRAQFALDLQVIQALVPEDQALPLLSRGDTLYYVASGRKALFKNSFYPHFFFKADLDDMVSALLSSPVEYLFGDNSRFQPYENGVDPSIAHIVWGRVANRYRFFRRAGLLDVYQRIPAATK